MNQNNLELAWNEITEDSYRDMIFVDIRENIETSLWPVSQFKPLLSPLSTFSFDTFTIDADQTYLFFCAKGVRSLHLVKECHRRGYENTYSLKDGMNAIKQLTENFHR